MGTRQRILHILTPRGGQPPTALAMGGMASAGDLIADLGRFPASAWKVGDGQVCTDITADLLPPSDYWAVARQWLIDFTDRTGLQDALAIDGYGFWWTLNGQKFVPAVSEIGNVFSWVDLLTTIREQFAPDLVIIHGQHDSIVHLAGQIFAGVPIHVSPAATAQRAAKSAVPRRPGLLFARVLLGITYLLFSWIWHPDICFLAATTLLRETTDGTKTRLRDVYFGDVIQALQTRGWRTVVVEKYGVNASWRALLARGFFFPNDLVFLLSAPAWQKLGLYRSLAVKWRRRWEAIQSSLAPHMVYRGYDLSPLLLPLLAREFNQHAPNLEIMVRLWRRILKLWRPRLLYVNDSYGRSAAPVIIAAKNLGILTVEQQHGVMNRDHIPYLVPRQLKRQVEFPLCDRMIVWGDYVKRLLVSRGVYRPEQVVVCGFPRIDVLVGDLPPREQTLAQLGIPREAQIVLYTSNLVAQGLMPDILNSIRDLPNSPKVYWIIKLHPREATSELWQAESERRQLGTVKVVQNEIDFYALLAACDVHVSFTSTTLLEAAILGKLNLGFEVPQIPDPVGFAEAGASLPVTPTELGSMVHRVLADSELREELLRQQKSFATDWCLHDGRATERIVSLIEAIVKQPTERIGDGTD